MIKKPCAQCFFAIDGYCRLEQNAAKQYESCRNYEPLAFTTAGGGAL
ncbi:MAG: cleavage protein [Peptococcaceae bacterium]|jgi:hypothetical protein|nr:cleavage protein [Peptococcaceae bacterium]